MKKIKILFASGEGLKKVSEELYASGLFEIYHCEPRRMELLTSCLVYRPDAVVIEAGADRSLSGNEIILAANAIRKTSEEPKVMVYSRERFTADIPLPKGVCLINERSYTAAAEEILLHLYFSYADNTAAAVYSGEQLVYKTVDELGFTANYKGMTYMVEVFMGMLNGEISINSSLCKIIYPYIAKKYGVSPGSVERSIRFAISKSWARVEPHCKHRYFGLTYHKATAPTNREYIMIVYDRLRRMHFSASDETDEEKS